VGKILVFLVNSFLMSNANKTSERNNMATAELFSLALGLEEPWNVSDVKFDPANRRLDLTI